MSAQTSALYTHKCRDCRTLTHVNPLSDIQLFRTFIEIRHAYERIHRGLSNFPLRANKLYKAKMRVKVTIVKLHYLMVLNKYMRR